MTPRILIVGSTYVYDAAMVELTKLWARVTTHLNPGIDIVLIDPASPFDPSEFLGWDKLNTDDGSVKVEVPPGCINPMNPRVGASREIYRFSDNIGHLSRGGEDGAGRCFCKAFELAAAGGYDYLAFCEADILFFRPFAPIIQRMANSGTKVAALPMSQYNFPEFGVSFYDMKFAKEFDLPGKYDWKKSQPWPIPEIRLMNLLQDYLMLLPLYGMRNDQNLLTVENLANCYPYAPIAWLTHCQSFDLYLRAIVLNNIQLS